MDQATVETYDRNAAHFAQEWADQPAPEDLKEIAQRFFRPGPTADIGCGSGRDVAWLNELGFPTVGYDASQGLLTEARRRYPNYVFAKSALPDLKEVEGPFTNLFCETVIMHLPEAEIAPSVQRLVNLLAPGGTLYLSWRVTPESDRRDEHGRLYAAFEEAPVYEALKATTLLLDERTVSESSGKIVRRLVARTAD